MFHTKMLRAIDQVCGRVLGAIRPSRQIVTMDALETRTLMSALPTGQAEIEWNGQAVRVWEGRYVVQMNNLSGRTAEQRRLAQGQFSASGSDAIVTGHLGKRGLLAVRSSARSAQELAKDLEGVAGVRRIEPDFVLTATVFSNDPALPQTWGLHNVAQNYGVDDADIDAPEAWDRTTGSSDVVVGIIDSGIDYTHPDLAANIWTNPGEIAGDGLDNDGNGFVDDVHGWDFASDDNDPMDLNGHGTHVAGTIGGVGNNSIGIAGVNWDVSMMALRFLDASGSGATSDAIAAINYATMMARDHGINVRLTNNSWGGGGYSQTLKDAIAASGQQNMLFVAAAGNSSGNNDIVPQYPANYGLSNIISVAATDDQDQLASFSCFGAGSVHLGAPGVDIYSTIPGGAYASYSGTSMAAPHVSGVAALAWALKGDATAAEVRNAILSGADPIASLQGRTATGARLNARRTLDLLLPQAGTISGNAFHDLNRNGVRDAGEERLAGRTIWLDANDNGILDVGEPSTLTDTYGGYTFSQLAPGVYHVRQLVPEGWLVTAPLDATVVLAPEVGLNLDFATRLPRSGFSGRIFDDRNANGAQEDGETGIPGLIVFDENHNGALDQQAGDFVSAEVPRAFGADMTVSHALVTGLSGVIRDVDITFDITHTWDADVELFLISPGGTRVRLLANVGGSSDNFTGTTLDDEAAASIFSGAAPFSGTYQPLEPLAAFDGENGVGAWTLEVHDNFPAADHGTLNSWSLHITTGEDAVNTQSDGTFAIIRAPGTYRVVPFVSSSWGMVSHAMPLDLEVVYDQEMVGADYGMRQNHLRLMAYDDLDRDGVYEDEPALPDRVLYIDSNHNGLFDGSNALDASTHPPVPITDLHTSTATIQVGPRHGTIIDVDVHLNITHTWDADLDVYLISPTGKRVRLFDDVGSSGNNFTNTILDDEAQTDITSGSAPFTGRYRPEQSLSAFDGLDPQGTWTLEVYDDAGSDVGQIVDWKLHIVTGETSMRSDENGLIDIIGIPAGAYDIGQLVPQNWLDLSGVRHVEVAPAADLLERFASDAMTAEEVGWARNWGSGEPDEAAAVAIDRLGNVISGSTVGVRGDYGSNPGNGSVLLDKRDPAGNLLWQVLIDNPGSDQRLGGLAVDADGNIAIIGGFTGIVDFDPRPEHQSMLSASTYGTYVALYTPDGQLKWATQIGGNNGAWDIGRSVAFDALGSLVVGGSLASNLYIARFDGASGQTLWEYQGIGGSGYYDGVMGVAVGLDGSVYATGTYCSGAIAAAVDFDPLATHPGNADILPAPDFGDLFALKLGADGSFRWVRGAQAPGWQSGQAIALAGNETVYLTARFQTQAGTLSDLDPTSGIDLQGGSQTGSLDGMLWKLLSNGDYGWTRIWGAWGQEDALALTTLPDGSAIVGGTFGVIHDPAWTGTYAASFDPLAPANGVMLSTTNAPADGFLMRVDSHGQLVWAQDLGGDGADAITGLTSDAAGHVYAVGYFEGTIQVPTTTGTLTLTSIGQSDALLIKSIALPAVFTPEVMISGNDIEITCGDTTPALADLTDFGTALVGRTAPRHTFTVRNTGTVGLALGTPQIPAGFVLDEPLAASLAPGESDEFSIHMLTDAAGIRGGEVIVPSGDDDENPYRFTIAGQVVPPPLAVTSLLPNPSGFAITFNRPVDVGQLNLGAIGGNPTMAVPDLTLIGPDLQAVRGSLHWNAASNTANFVMTGGLLAPGAYALTLRSAVDGWADTSGAPLDGDGNDVAGGDYSATFTIAPSVARVLSIPDFARGPGQSVDVNLNGTASAMRLPVRLSDGTNVLAVDFQLHYDPALLSISNVLAPAGSGLNVLANVISPGVLSVTVASNGPAFPADAQTIVEIVASVPLDASYGASQVLKLTNISINEAAIPAVGDSAFHHVAYFGDATGDGSLSSLDATRILRQVVAIDTGFAAHPLTDPLIIGDVTGNGAFSGLDATYVARESVGFDEPSIPPYALDQQSMTVEPARIIDKGDGALPMASAEATVTVSIPQHLVARPGERVVVPVTLSDATGLLAADVTISYDTTRLNLADADVKLGELAAGWLLVRNVTDATGLARMSAYAINPLTAGAGSILSLDFTVLDTVIAPPTSVMPLQLLNAPRPGTRLNEASIPASLEHGSIVVPRAGDADFDNDIDADDYFRIDAGFLSQDSAPATNAWSNGDFNLDGRIDIDDYFLIDTAYATQDQSAQNNAEPATRNPLAEVELFNDVLESAAGDVLEFGRAAVELLN